MQKVEGSNPFSRFRKGLHLQVFRKRPERIARRTVTIVPGGGGMVTLERRAGHPMGWPTLPMALLKWAGWTTRSRSPSS
jgi:hypothetical protein